jgi:hypothetical protein
MTGTRVKIANGADTSAAVNPLKFPLIHLLCFSIRVPFTVAYLFAHNRATRGSDWDLAAIPKSGSLSVGTLVQVMCEAHDPEDGALAWLAAREAV